MLDLLKPLIGRKVLLEISGNKRIIGILIDIGADLLVVFDGKDYNYISNAHVHYCLSVDDDSMELPEKPSEIEIEDELSLRKVLSYAKGSFVEILVNGNEYIHGYISSLMNNYFTFYTPLYKNIFISIHHLKIVRPYPLGKTPYSLTSQQLPLHPTTNSLARTFEVQLNRYVDQLVVFNLGEKEISVGKLEDIKNNIVKFKLAKGGQAFINLQHIKSFYIP
ncbi:DUF2642 domain-containing protein [Bacillus kexueae]|uniref:DUF2642 domain-containing protein n=1 Tax=Aeribacillus kexueae TaxID=2078952 RepID=UPI001FAEDD63|nr:DUF2642 domain-containing protein [Bacillus kexueae]